LLTGETVRDAGLFDPGAVELLWRKCQASGGEGQFSNADNMALVGVLSTGLLHEQFVRMAPSRAAPGSFLTSIDRLAGRNPGPALEERAEPRIAT
jgi:asparagine synthase (glutamine-hydrolysing)